MTTQAFRPNFDDAAVSEADNEVLRGWLQRERVASPTTGVHPFVIQISLSGVAWFLAVAWLDFSGPEVNPALAVVLGFFVMYFTLFLLTAFPRWGLPKEASPTFSKTKCPSTSVPAARPTPRGFFYPKATDPEANRRIQTPKARPHIGVEPQFFDKEVNLMKSAFPILAAVALLLGASTAQAARPMGNSNIILAPTPPLQSSPPPTTNLGALNLPQNPAALGVPGQGSFGALPGNPGSATYNPNAALPTLGNSGSAILPDQGTSAAGINAPSTNVNGGM